MSVLSLARSYLKKNVPPNIFFAQLPFSEPKNYANIVFYHELQSSIVDILNI